jgi:hypothetical protein
MIKVKEVNNDTKLLLINGQILIAVQLLFLKSIEIYEIFVYKNVICDNGLDEI